MTRSAHAHAWLADGSSLHDYMGSGFTLLKLGSRSLDSRELEEAFSRNGVPLKVVEVKEDRLLEIYGNNLFVLRSDLHIAWSSTVPPADADALVSSLVGHPTSVRATV